MVDDDIYVKLQLEKKSKSKSIGLRVQFDTDAPNFSSNKNEITWSPTPEEIDFIVQSFQMLSEKQYSSSPSYQHTEQKTQTAPIDYENLQPLASPKAKNAAVEPMEITEDELPTKETPKNEEDQLFIQADELTIDEVIKRKSNEYKEELASKSNQKAVIDKVLKQRSKKRWK